MGSQDPASVGLCVSTPAERLIKMQEDKVSVKKPFYKKWWFWVIVVVVLFTIGNNAKNTPPNQETSVPAVADRTEQAEPTTTPAPVTPTMQTLLELKGNGSKTTQKFTASGDWDLEWTYDCSNFYGGQGVFQVYVYNHDGTMSFQNGLINQSGSKDAGVEHYHKGGTFYLQVNSVCAWTMKVTG